MICKILILLVACALLEAQIYQPDYLAELEVLDLQASVSAKGYAPATVFVMGGGIQCSHPQLEGKVDQARSKSFVDNNFPCLPDQQGHDGLVANIVQTITGRENVNFVILKVCADEKCPVQAVTAAFEYISSLDFEGTAVVNCSFVTSESLFLREAIERLRNRVLIIAAAGNNRRPQMTYPCAYGSVFGHVLCVAALRADGDLLGNSNWGGWIEIAARGDNMCGNGFACSSGTSFAAPVVAGLAALLYQNTDVFLTPALLKRLLIAGAKENPALIGRLANLAQATGSKLVAIAERILGEWELKPTHAQLFTGKLGAVAFSGNPIPLNGLLVKGNLTSEDRTFEWEPAGPYGIGSNFISLLVEVPPGEYMMSLEIEGLIRPAPFKVQVE